MKKVEEMFIAGGRFDKDGPGAIAKDHAGGTIGVIDDGRHDVGADYKHLLVSARFNEFDTRLESINEAGTGGGDVVSPGAFGANAVLNQASRGREQHVGGDGGEKDGFDFRGRNAAFQ